RSSAWAKSRRRRPGANAATPNKAASECPLQATEEAGAVSAAPAFALEHHFTSSRGSYAGTATKNSPGRIAVVGERRAALVPRQPNRLSPGVRLFRPLQHPVSGGAASLHRYP